MGPTHRGSSPGNTKAQGVAQAKIAISLPYPSNNVYCKHIFCAAGDSVIDRRILFSGAGVYSLTFLKRNLESVPDTTSAPSPCTSECKGSEGDGADD